MSIKRGVFLDMLKALIQKNPSIMRDTPACSDCLEKFSRFFPGPA